MLRVQERPHEVPVGQRPAYRGLQSALRGQRAVHNLCDWRHVSGGEVPACCCFPTCFCSLTMLCSALCLRVCRTACRSASPCTRFPARRRRFPSPRSPWVTITHVRALSQFILSRLDRSACIQRRLRPCLCLCRAQAESPCSGQCAAGEAHLFNSALPASLPLVTRLHVRVRVREQGLVRRCWGDDQDRCAGRSGLPTYLVCVSVCCC